MEINLQCGLVMAEVPSQMTCLSTNKSNPHLTKLPTPLLTIGRPSIHRDAVNTLGDPPPEVQLFGIRIRALPGHAENLHAEPGEPRRTRRTLANTTKESLGEMVGYFHRRLYRG